jgi:crossover junction endodeoxyribonuclease RuvC
LEKSGKIILGIDPGTSMMGYGLIEIIGKDMKLHDMGIINLTKIQGHDQKLKKIFEKVLVLVDTHSPDELAVEAPFFGKNVQSMLKLGRAQGVAMAAALYRDIPIFEYSPRKIKQAVTGNGNASKEQVAKMLQTLLKIDKLPKNQDATDGVAAAVCHHFQNNHGVQGKSYGSWKSFLTDNPDKKMT